MGELIISVLQVVGLFTGRWLLPKVSGGRIILMPDDAPIGLFPLAPYARLPNGKIGVDGVFVGTLLAMLFLIAMVGLCCLIL
ncbi:MAG: hypothetical protein HY852_00810 [Bradyrhizobium sp.]|uniref:hypothetical protein n=1 Tax=Bradyrhizobium sp. TaxID=376 RepID=UPI0025B9C120|nr:hypothetical protein [Bradyrhizobium sp.]MBI5260340.1 hypothetical protein [Bradyrhizobium sp.]